MAIREDSDVQSPHPDDASRQQTPPAPADDHGVMVGTALAVPGRGAERSGSLVPVKRWLLQGHTKDVHGAHQRPQAHKVHPWWQVMCLTGVDYFSTLGYQPGIAALAAGALSPIATLILVLLTLLGALPMYRRVAGESPHGEGSIAMLERLLPFWQGKLFVLCLLGFAATDFVITITLSAADATAHLLENPFFPDALGDQRVGVTLFLLLILGAVFLKGFGEAIGIAVGLVGVYLVLNAVVVGVSLAQVFAHPIIIREWQQALLVEHGNPWMMLAVSLLLFPKLALGLSGFETGVAVMPLVKGYRSDTEEEPIGRIRNTRRLLLTAAFLMSAFLITSSFVTIVLIPAAEFEAGGRANGRALAYLAHELLGEGFGTVYDVSTILILWFAGASAMAGLLNIVPRYLPRYGMAPEWTGAVRPLVLVFTTIAFTVTVLFDADVDAQGGAYATGVLVLMSSAAVAVTLSARRRGGNLATIGFGLIALVFAYTTVVNVIERPDGVKIATFFISAIILVSLVSRVWRVTELRVAKIELDAKSQRYISDAARHGTIHVIAHDPEHRRSNEYSLKEREQRISSRIPPDDSVIFLEVVVCDPSDFAPVVNVTGKQVARHKILRAEGATIPNTIAAFLLHLRDTTDQIPHVYFAWSEAGPVTQVLRYLLFGEGDVAPVTHEVLRRAERNPKLRPVIHVA